MTEPESPRPYLQRLEVEGFRCIKKAAFDLTRLHAFIGPNDVGKSTILEVVSRSAQISANAAGMRFQLLLPSVRLSFRVGVLPQEHEWSLSIGTSSSFHETFDGGSGPLTLGVNQPRFESIRALNGASRLRLDPDFLRKETPLTTDDQPLRFTDERGMGLPAIYDGILVRDPRAYLELNDDLKKRFPHLKQIRPRNPTQGTKAMAIELNDGTLVGPNEMSEGLLYFLAFAALPFLDLSAILLIEEPENGLHPSRIAEVMSILRHLSSKVQVLIATHSPLVVNELKADEITVVTRTPELGTQGVLLKDTPHYGRRSQVYNNGELWLSYANGTDEAPLLQGLPQELPSYSDE